MEDLRSYVAKKIFCDRKISRAFFDRIYNHPETVQTLNEDYLESKRNYKNSEQD